MISLLVLWAVASAAAWVVLAVAVYRFGFLRGEVAENRAWRQAQEKAAAVAAVKADDGDDEESSYW